MITRKYIEFNLSQGFPAENFIHYECGICGDTIASIPVNAAACKCRNIIVDADAGRVAVKDKTKIKVFEV